MNSDIQAWIARSQDPRSDAVAALCEIIEATDPRVVGEIKWGAPSYRITEHFATTGLNARAETVRLVLHAGARPRPGRPAPVIHDPGRLADWKSADRAILVFRDEAEVRSKRAALMHIVRQWIEQTQDIADGSEGPLG